ncbi:MAG TPA: diphthine synthase [Candidatus Bathyarchaeia archaeon]|jgi:diphthine synthase|nr:diphthine synthase [Candidatus Bathyarchaeia archaeon]
MTVAFIGLGLHDEKSITLEGLEEARHADTVFAEFYTNIMPSLDLKKLEEKIRQRIVVLNRRQLEDESGRDIVRAASTGDVAFLVPGDPMVATTHIAVRLDLARRGIPSRIVHGPSVSSAVCGATGLQNNKFGKPTTLPHEPNVPGSVLETLRDNRTRGLHTLVLLDIRPELQDQLTAGSASSKLVGADGALSEWIGIGLARLGSHDEKVLCRRLGELQHIDLGNAPHSLVIPGKLHFIEVESLHAFCNARSEDLEMLK